MQPNVNFNHKLKQLFFFVVCCVLFNLIILQLPMLAFRSSPISTATQEQDSARFGQQMNTVLDESGDRDIQVRDNKTRILVLGFGHSGTSYIQQFIGSVLFDSTDDVFYLFEAVHLVTLRYAVPYHTTNSSITMNYNEEMSKLLTRFLECNFPESVDYARSLRHYNFIKRINQMKSRVGQPSLRSMSFARWMQHKCVGAKALVYKEIHMHRYQEYVPKLWQKFPRLKIIATVRNPLTHLPSLRLLSVGTPVITDANFYIQHGCWRKEHCEVSHEALVSTICDHQRQQIFSLLHDDRFSVLQMEEFFRNLSDSQSLQGSIEYFNTVLFRHSALDLFKMHSLDVYQQRYRAMNHSLWKFNIRLKQKHFLTAPETELLLTECQQFNQMFGY